jgi:hypothetical protein
MSNTHLAHHNGPGVLLWTTVFRYGRVHYNPDLNKVLNLEKDSLLHEKG